MTEGPINKTTLEKYLELDRKIHEQESKNTIKALSVKEAQAKDLEQTVKELQKHYDKCVKDTAKEKKDVDNMPNIRSIFENQSKFNAQLSKEQEEYVDALSKEEIAKKELEGVKEQQQAVQKEVDRLEGEKKTLTALYEEFDAFLGSIFKGEYGSAEENKLEVQLDNVKDQKQRIDVAHYKWTHARKLLATGVSQLAMAVKKWEEVKKIKDQKLKYDAATDARNNIVAATQNLTSTQKYLSNITFPYCKPEEIATLNRATTHIYTDMCTDDRHAHAHQCYNVTQKRAAALLAWFDNVIKNTIEKDLEKSKGQTHTLETELRKERLRLIKQKIAEESGDSNVQVKGEMDLGKEAKADKNETEYVSQATPGAKPAPAAAPAVVPLNQLAPPPNQDELFGQLEGLKQQHEKDMQEFEKAQDMNKTRMEQGLAEKLAARRNRRQRMDAEAH